jgi:hypothetical protein
LGEICFCSGVVRIENALPSDFLRGHAKLLRGHRAASHFCSIRCVWSRNRLPMRGVLDI